MWFLHFGPSRKLRNPSPDGFPDPLYLFGRDSLCNSHGGDAPRLGDDHVRGGSLSVLDHLVQHQLGNLRWLDGWLVGWLIGWLVGCLNGQLIGRLVG